MTLTLTKDVEQGGEPSEPEEPEVPETVIVANVEKEVTITAWNTVAYTFTADKDGKYTITLSEISGDGYTVKVNGGDPIIDGDFGQTSATFNAVAGQENTIEIYSGSNRTFKVLISGGEEEVEGVTFQMTVGKSQSEDYLFNAPEAGIYRITLSGINAGDVTINGIIDETELTGTFKARTAGQEIILQFWGNKASTFTATITLEQSLEGSDGKLHVGGSLDVSVPGIYGSATEVVIEGLVAGQAYSLTITESDTNLNRDWIYVNYAGKQYQLEAMQMTVTFIATSANTLSVTSNMMGGAGAAQITVALNNALALGGNPFDVEVAESTTLTVYMAGIVEGKSYTVMTPFSAGLGRAGVTLGYNGQSIKFELDEEDFMMKATFTAVMDDYNHLISYITITSDAIEPTMGTLTVSMVAAEGSGEEGGGEEGGGEPSGPVLVKTITATVTVVSWEGNYTFDFSDVAEGTYILKITEKNNFNGNIQLKLNGSLKTDFAGTSEYSIEVSASNVWSLYLMSNGAGNATVTFMFELITA